MYIKNKYIYQNYKCINNYIIIIRLYFYLFLYQKYESNSFLDFIKDESVKLKVKINNFNKELYEVEKQILDIKNFIKEKKDIINNIKKKLTKINNELNDNSDIIKKINESLNKLKEQDLNELKYNIPLLLKKEEKLISVIFIYFDENIHYSIICKNTDQFSKIESLLYDKYPEYKKLKNSFILNGKEIDRQKSLEDNTIKNCDIITLKINE